MKIVGNDYPVAGTVVENFIGIHPDGNTAMVQRTKENDHAQFDNPEHERSAGWWKYPLNTFEKVKEN